MFLKPIESKLLMYYGIFVSTGELSVAMKRSKFQGDAYAFFSGHGVDYDHAQGISNSNEWIIGKRMQVVDNFVKTQINFSDDLHYALSAADIKKLTVQEELDIRKKLFGMGFFSDLRYWLVQNYKSNRIE